MLQRSTRRRGLDSVYERLWKRSLADTRYFYQLDLALPASALFPLQQRLKQAAPKLPFPSSTNTLCWPNGATQQTLFQTVKDQGYLPSAHDVRGHFLLITRTNSTSLIISLHHHLCDGVRGLTLLHHLLFDHPHPIPERAYRHATPRRNWAALNDATRAFITNQPKQACHTRPNPVDIYLIQPRQYLHKQKKASQLSLNQTLLLQYARAWSFAQQDPRSTISIMLIQAASQHQNQNQNQFGLAYYRLTPSIDTQNIAAQILNQSPEANSFSHHLAKAFNIAHYAPFALCQRIISRISNCDICLSLLPVSLGKATILEHPIQHHRLYRIDQSNGVFATTFLDRHTLHHNATLYDSNIDSHRFIEALKHIPTPNN